MPRETAPITSVASLRRSGRVHPYPLPTALSDSGEEEIVTGEPPEEMRRRLALQNHRWVSEHEFTPICIRCKGCGKSRSLDKRNKWYPTNWNKHVGGRCHGIREHYLREGVLTNEIAEKKMIEEVGEEPAKKIMDKLRRKSAGVPKPISSSSSTPPGSSTTDTLSFSASSPDFSIPNDDETDIEIEAVDPEGSCGDADVVPYHQTLAYRIELALPRVAADHGQFYCCGAFQHNPAEHRIAHQLGMTPSYQ